MNDYLVVTPHDLLTAAPAAQDKQNIGHTAAGRIVAPRTRQPPTTFPATRSAMSPTPDNPVRLADSTQTVRALTQSELDDPSQLKWYVVQLVVSDQPVNLAAMPHLDIFAIYRLYSVSRQQGTPRHALRLGFFSEEAYAKMVCGHLKTFYASAAVVRIGAAEQARFADPLRPKVQSQNSTGAASVAKAAASPARPAVLHPAAQQAVPALKQSVLLPKPAAAGSAQQRIKRPRSLSEELLEEARQIQMSKTGRHRIPERTGSWLSRLVGRSKS